MQNSLQYIAEMTRDRYLKNMSSIFRKVLFYEEGNKIVVRGNKIASKYSQVLLGATLTSGDFNESI